MLFDCFSRPLKYFSPAKKCGSSCTLAKCDLEAEDGEPGPLMDVSTTKCELFMFQLAKTHSEVKIANRSSECLHNAPPPSFNQRAQLSLLEASHTLLSAHILANSEFCTRKPVSVYECVTPRGGCRKRRPAPVLTKEVLNQYKRVLPTELPIFREEKYVRTYTRGGFRINIKVSHSKQRDKVPGSRQNIPSTGTRRYLHLFCALEADAMSSMLSKIVTQQEYILLNSDRGRLPRIN